VLLIAVAVSLIVNIFQVLTSLQDNTVSTVTRLLVTGGALFFMMPWMLRHLTNYTLNILSDFHGYLK
jgi:flagellar biosynthetic protein FliQ